MNKAKKRSRQRKQRIEALDIPLFNHQPAPEVLMTFYRDRADGPIHAIEFTVVEDGQTLRRVKPIHLKGVPQSKLRSHIQECHRPPEGSVQTPVDGRPRETAY